MIMDKYERKEFIKKATKAENVISVGITWVDLRIVLKPTAKQSRAYVGICHFSAGIFSITPLDYLKPTMMTQIRVSPLEDYCEKAFSCLCFHCKLNKFNKGFLIDEFKDCGGYTLGLPHDLGTKPLWFNSGKWKDVWRKFMISPEGGVLKFREMPK